LKANALAKAAASELLEQEAREAERAAVSKAAADEAAADARAAAVEIESAAAAAAAAAFVVQTQAESAVAAADARTNLIAAIVGIVVLVGLLVAAYRYRLRQIALRPINLSAHLEQMLAAGMIERRQLQHDLTPREISRSNLQLGAWLVEAG
jgi:hypothetical protein